MVSADAWTYSFTDLGEARGALPHPVLRAVIPVSTPGALATVAAIIDSGGPVSVVSPAFARLVVAPGPPSGSLVIKLAGRRYEAPLVEMDLAIQRGASISTPSRGWRSTVAVIDPWPHPAAAAILGHAGFLDRFTITFGPNGFAVEAGPAFADRFGTP